MKQSVVTAAFLLAEAVLYGLILTAGGSLLVWSSFLAIVVCFLYALLHIRQGERLIVAGLACTVAADFCLVVCSPVQRLWGMVFFLIAQSIYALWLYRSRPDRKLLLFRVLLIVAAELLTVAVLREKTDALALVSLCYYAELIVNILAAFANFRNRKSFAVALTLFLLCDTVIGLQVAAGAYLPIGEGSLLHRVIFMDFNLSWFFYLPSQVLIALNSRKMNAQ